MVRVLGIDPALAAIGYAVIDGKTQFVDDTTTLLGAATLVDYGIVLTDANATIGDRLALIAERIEAIAREHKPDIVTLEKPIFTSASVNAAIVQYATGAILLALRNAGYTDLLFFSPPSIKKELLGVGKFKTQKEGKLAIKGFVTNLFEVKAIKSKDDHYDAIAVAYAGLTVPEKAYIQQSYSSKKKKAKPKDYVPKKPRKASAKAA